MENGKEKMENASDGIEVKKKGTQTSLISQTKTPNQKVGNEEKVQTLLGLMRNMNITLPVVATL